MTDAQKHLIRERAHDLADNSRLPLSHVGFGNELFHFAASEIQAIFDRLEQRAKAAQVDINLAMKSGDRDSSLRQQAIADAFNEALRIFTETTID